LRTIDIIIDNKDINKSVKPRNWKTWTNLAYKSTHNFI